MDFTCFSRLSARTMIWGSCLRRREKLKKQNT